MCLPSDEKVTAATTPPWRASVAIALLVAASHSRAVWSQPSYQFLSQRRAIRAGVGDEDLGPFSRIFGGRHFA
jgi:hypothetical protein